MLVEGVVLVGVLVLVRRLFCSVGGMVAVVLLGDTAVL